MDAIQGRQNWFERKVPGVSARAGVHSPAGERPSDRSAQKTSRIWVRRLFGSWARGAFTMLLACTAIAAGGFTYTTLSQATASDRTGGTTNSAPPSAVLASAPAAAASAIGAGSRPVINAGALAVEGKRLAGNPHLMLGPTARAQLISGRVDQRVTSTLQLLLERHMIQVTTFGATEPGTPLRAITIDCIDELPVMAGSRETTAVLGFFDNLRPPLAPQSVQLTMRGKSTVISATYYKSLKPYL